MGLRAFAVGLVASLLVAAALACTAPPAHAGTAPPPLKVGLYENPPKVYSDAQGRPSGLFVELLQAIGREEGWRIEWVPCRWDDCLRQLEAGQLDLMPDVAYSRERARRFDFHEVPVAFSWSQAFARPGIEVRSFPELGNRRVAVLRGSVQQAELEQVLGGLGIPWTAVEAETYEDAFDSVRAGRADVAVANNYFGRRVASSYGLAETPVVFNPASLYFAAPRQARMHELARIDGWLSRWRDQEDSVYFRAMSRALVPVPATVTPGWLRPALVAGVVAIAGLLGLTLVQRWRVRRATASAHGAQQRLEQVLAHSPVVLLLAHLERNRLVIDWVSANALRLYGFWIADMMKPGWWAGRVHPEDLAALDDALARLGSRGAVTREYRLTDGRGQLRHVHEELRTMPVGRDGVVRVLATWTDLSEAKAHADALSHASSHDALTGLPNRLRLEAELRDLVEEGAPFSVVVLDIDRLRSINDTLGHSVGDLALQAAARRLGTLLPAQGFLSRLGGDEFAMLLPGEMSTAALDAFGELVQETFARPLVEREVEAILSASVGTARFPHDGADAQTLLKHAELALYEAKRQGPGRRHAFDAALSTEAMRRLQMESGLRMAMSRGQLSLHYQPQVRLADGRLVGVEALLRWRHPQWGFVPPEQFIPVAEASGMMEALGMWVMLEACRQLRTWDEAGLRVPSVSVNCSVQQLDADRLPAQVADVLERTGLAPERLELEITESMLMRDPEPAIAALEALKSQAIRIAIDDFGTGHSSLAYLRRLPVTRLKIDRSFVGGIGHQDSDEQICRTVIALARSLQLETLAEGVEYPHEAAFLHQEGCELAQGYHYARPMPPEDLADWLAGREAGLKAVVGPTG